MSNFWVAVVSGLTVLAIAGTVKGGTRYAGKTVLMGLLLHAFRSGRDYVRSGCRWQAALYFDHPTNQAHASIGTRVVLPDVVLRDTEKLLQEAVSRPFQRKASFAWQVYATWVPYCAGLYHKSLTIEGYTPPVGLAEWHDAWTIDFGDVDGQPSIIRQAGWCPIPQLPLQRVRDHRNEGAEVPLAWPPR